MPQFASVSCTVLAISEWVYSAGSRFLEVPWRKAATKVSCSRVRATCPEAESGALVRVQQIPFLASTPPIECRKRVIEAEGIGPHVVLA